MKFLCVCQGGNVRSHALAYLLHDRYKQEAIGFERVSQSTLDYFCEWADIIVLLRETYKTCIAAPFESKVRVIDVGDDRWGPRIPKDLKELLYPTLESWKAAGWESAA